MNLNHPDQAMETPPTHPLQIGACEPIGVFRSFHVCSTSAIPVTPLFGHAERTAYFFVMTYVSGPAFNEGRTASGFARFYINDKGVFYPKIRIRPEWATANVYAAGAGYVRFPGGPFLYCSKSNASLKCHVKDRGDLRKRMLEALPRPPLYFQAHHIKPVSWCGDNSLDNGVWLSTTAADDESLWDPFSHAQYNNWWEPRQLQSRETAAGLLT